MEILCQTQQSIILVKRYGNTTLEISETFLGVVPLIHTLYSILVSEVMLQQTQVNRVVPKYKEFLKKFPNIRALAIAPISDVLIVWQGLGYNRRALFLKRTCEELYKRNQKNPVFPTLHSELLKLPGIGQSTAGALLAFAFNTPVPFIETNIRAVFIYFFFKDSSSVSDIHIHELLSETLAEKKNKSNPRDWYYALYDYGSMLKAKLGKDKTALHKQSLHYTKQSAFKGSNREIRSAILKLIIDATKIPKDQNGTPRKNITLKEIISNIAKKLPQSTSQNIIKNVSNLIEEGFILEVNQKTDQSRPNDIKLEKNTPFKKELRMNSKYAISVV